ncbi:hypothetical protein V5O48_010632 [Marasmius crinis-equi]|uniref:Uncharacterized protein n=1 Tax=Marasmius crinis-equi TaxID=585013 RepID=A0ABR3F897_9AGAR
MATDNKPENIQPPQKEILSLLNDLRVCTGYDLTSIMFCQVNLRSNVYQRKELSAAQAYCDGEGTERDWAEAAEKNGKNEQKDRAIKS